MTETSTIAEDIQEQKDIEEIPKTQNYDEIEKDSKKSIMDDIDFDGLKEKLGCTSEELIELLVDYQNSPIHEEEEEEAESEMSEQDYGSPSYWDERYEICTDPFDWYRKWSVLEKTLKPLFNGDEIVLNIGCGNSEMSADMQKSTFQTVVSIDISSVVIEQMLEKYQDNPNLIWFTMDCMNMTFEDEFFDLVFDKGTLDAIMCGENSTRNVFLTIDEIHRVLRSGGLFIEITYGEPSYRMDLFSSVGSGWKLYDPIIINDTSDDSKTQLHYVYIFQKVSEVYDDDDLEDYNNNDDDDDDSDNDENNKNEEDENDNNEGNENNRNEEDENLRNEERKGTDEM
ncbi:hypothetical protein TRFO_34588 [Tritrichomonas foetus]|uniref:Methyltransferase type 11 domain-containing protein n=1 Tax=Tritrichomonas foetus TaxID=1144522 RepID=A0A1J4JP91_9EUKA|nr:hypothetical protein TRFO_34588 [Tritrichomonas foetus]|eukprot:OHS99092.1 hypothetical protein TRFO_34588 [Tritrichomonas foetus]